MAGGSLEIFGNSQKIRGCFTRFNYLIGAKGLGAQLVLPAGGTKLPLTNSNVDPLIVVGVEFAEKEKFHIVQCFQDTNYVYAFGHDPMSSVIRVSYISFLIANGGTSQSNAVTRFTNAYREGRLSASQELATLTLAGYTLQGFVIALNSGTADSQYNIQNFTIDLLAVKPYGSS